jgi:hypothetical protein
MMSPRASSDPPRTKRIVALVVGGLVVEAVLLAIVTLSPALAVLMRPIYVIVAILFGLAIWHGERRRTDRRHGDRRHTAPPE